MSTGAPGVVAVLSSRDVLGGLDEGQAVYVVGEVFAVRRDSTPLIVRRGRLGDRKQLA